MHLPGPFLLRRLTQIVSNFYIEMFIAKGSSLSYCGAIFSNPSRKNTATTYFSPVEPSIVKRSGSTMTKISRHGSKGGLGSLW
jgi:hypothetical protein